MEQINNEILISNICMGMMNTLDDDQLKVLKNTLQIQLHDVEVTTKKYELVESIQQNDLIKLNYFENSLKVAKYSEGTILQYMRTIKLLRSFVAKDFEKITGADIKYYLAYNQQEKNWKDNTLKNNIHYLSAFFRFLEKEDLIQKNPMIKVDAVRSEKVIKESFTSEEMERLRKAARDDARSTALLEFLYATGIRINELCQLTWGDIDTRHLSLKVRGKGNKEREVLFSEKAAFHLDEYFSERMKIENRSREDMLARPLFSDKRKDPETHDYEALENNGVRTILKKLGNKAHVNKVHPHRFRRTFATDAINRGMPLEQLRVLMGHNNYDTTLGYAKVNNKQVVQSYRTCCE